MLLTVALVWVQFIDVQAIKGEADIDTKFKKIMSLLSLCFLFTGLILCVLLFALRIKSKYYESVIGSGHLLLSGLAICSSALLFRFGRKFEDIW